MYVDTDVDATEGQARDAALGMSRGVGCLCVDRCPTVNSLNSLGQHTSERTDFWRAETQGGIDHKDASCR